MTTTPASGPCPVDGCDWDAEGALDDHLFTQHDEEDLAKVVVRLALENDRLAAVIRGVRDLCAEYSEAEGRGLAPRGSAFVHWVRSAVTDPAPTKTEG